MPLITITSDIGEHDFLIGAIKGQILKSNPEFNIIDISHKLSPFNYPQAAYVCRNSLLNFPPGTFHLILVNMFDEKPEHLLLAQHNEQFIGCADNGLLTMILENEPEKVVAIPLSKTTPKSTLYCAKALTDSFYALIKGEDIYNLGEQKPIKTKYPLRPLVDANYIEGQIIFIDHFENVIVNITKEAFEEQRKGRRFYIVFKRDETIDQISESYADVPEGEKLAMFNAAGYLEIAVNKGNAAGLFGLQGYAENQFNNHLNPGLFYQTVKVFFQ